MHPVDIDQPCQFVPPYPLDYIRSDPKPQRLIETIERFEAADCDV